VAGITRTARVPARFPFLFLVLVNCYLPIVLIWLGVIPFAYRFHVLAAVLCNFVLYGLCRRYRFSELGLTLQGSRNSLLANALFCAVGCLGLYLVQKAGLLMPREHSYSLTSFLLYILFLAPVQEFIFRGILFAEMQRCRIVDPCIVLLVSTVTFSFLHIIYGHPPLLLITFVGGLVWGILYLRWPSLLGVSMSHALLGAFAMFLGVL
jgi:membrane protease YdiL (CAAX protease family)